MDGANALYTSSGYRPHAPADATCWICLEPEGEKRTRSRRRMLQRGCSCRGSSGWSHFPCLLRVLDRQEAQGNDWALCPMCKQHFTGDLELALARTRFERLARRPANCPERLAAQFFLAESMRFSNGAVNEARDIYEEILGIYRTELGPEHPNTLCVLDSLGELYLVQGKHARALPLLEEALELGRRVLGPEDNRTLCSVSALGRLHQNRGAYDLAIELLQFDLAASRRTMGNEHLDTLVSLANLGLCHLLREEYDKALAFMTEDLKTSKRVLGLEHPHTRVCMCNIGGLHTQMGNFDEAQGVLDELLAASEPSGGVDRVPGGATEPQELALYSALGLLNIAKGEYAAALPLLQKCLVGRVKALGNDHPTSHITAGHLGTCLSLMGEQAEGQQLVKRAVAGLHVEGMLESHFWLRKFKKTLGHEILEHEIPGTGAAAESVRGSATRTSARQRKRKLDAVDDVQKS